MTLKINSILEVVEIRVHKKIYQAKCSSSWIVVLTTFFALSRSGEKSKNPVLWPWPLTYILEL